MILEEDMLEVGATIANNPPKKASKDNRKIPKVIHHPRNATKIITAATVTRASLLQMITTSNVN